ncbi:MAG: nucleotidyltransferase family protein [Paracoccaceae bacterium]|nr:MAG: nucleotidyltransferase family protein [Paracoccaceae bacterium]
MPRALMLFAAGFGTRMGRLTADRPKPLIPVAGRPLIDHALGLADAAGADPIVVNLHYRGDQIAAHLEGRPVSLSWEREAILDTGGGLRAALPLLGPGPVFTLNSDGIFTGENPLSALQRGWDGGRMGALLSLLPADPGDFLMSADGRLARARGAPGYRYLGAQIIDPAGLSSIPDAAFSLNRIWDRMIGEGRAFGRVHRGAWCDVGRPEGIAEAESLLRGTDVR